MPGGMDRNVGGIDRVARLTFGGVFVLAAAAALGGFLQLSAVIAGVGLLIGLVLLVTGLIQFCPINRALGLNTRDEGSSESR